MKIKQAMSVVALMCGCAVFNTHAMSDILRRKFEQFAGNSALQSHAYNQAFIRGWAQGCMQEAINSDDLKNNVGKCAEFVSDYHRAAAQTYETARDLKRCSRLAKALGGSADQGLAAAATVSDLAAGITYGLSQSPDEAVSGAGSVLYFPFKRAAEVLTVGKYVMTDKRLAKYAWRAVREDVYHGDIREGLQSAAVSVATDAVLDHLPAKNYAWLDNYPYCADFINGFIRPYVAEMMIYNCGMNAANCVQGKPSKVYLSMAFGGR